MSKVLFVHILALRFQTVHNLVDFESIPVQYGIGNETEAARLVHNFLVIASGKFTLVGKENSSGQPVPVFSLIELELDSLPELRVGEVAQDILSFDNPPQVGNRFGQAIRRKAVGQSLHHHMSRGRALLGPIPTIVSPGAK